MMINILLLWILYLYQKYSAHFLVGLVMQVSTVIVECLLIIILIVFLSTENLHISLAPVVVHFVLLQCVRRDPLTELLQVTIVLHL